jgi:porin
MHFFYSLGIGGKGLILERPEDRFGFGFYYIDVKGLEFRGLLQNREFLRDEYGFEAFYNIAVTPWMFLTPDIQVVRGAQKDRLVVARGPLGIPIPVRKSIGTATILGIRLQLVF